MAERVPHQQLLGGGTAFNTDSSAGIHQRALWAYTQTDGIYCCPSDKSRWPCSGQLVLRPFNIGLSVPINGGVNGNTGRILDPLVVLALAEIRRPAGMCTFMDNHKESVTSGLFMVESHQNQRWWTIPGERDCGHGGNVAFSDGHVSFKKGQCLGQAQ